MKNTARVFVHISVLSGDICREKCKVVKLTAISKDGKQFCYEPDCSDYNADGWKMWSEFETFCNLCGLEHGRGEAWVAWSFVKSGIKCQPCSLSDCFNIFDRLNYLNDWQTKYLEWEYGCSNFMQKPQLGFDEFCKSCGLSVLSDAEDVRAMYRKYTEFIEKDNYSADECDRLVDYVRENSRGIFTAPDMRSLLDNRIRITRALLRLIRSSKEKFWQAIDIMCAVTQSGEDSFEETLYSFLSDFSCEYEDAVGVDLKGNWLECIYTPQNVGYLKALYLSRHN